MRRNNGSQNLWGLGRGAPPGDQAARHSALNRRQAVVIDKDISQANIILGIWASPATIRFLRVQMMNYLLGGGALLPVMTTSGLTGGWRTAFPAPFSPG